MGINELFAGLLTDHPGSLEEVACWDGEEDSCKIC